MFKYFYQEMPSDNCKIVALYADGSGANLFEIKNAKVIVEYQSTGCEELESKDWFIDCDYLMWAYLPDNFILWGEE